jgi:hypothetical protein
MQANGFTALRVAVELAGARIEAPLWSEKYS